MRSRLFLLLRSILLAIIVWCPVGAQVQPVQSFALNNYVRVLDGQWEGIRYASDGNVYFGSTSQGAHHGAAFFKYDPRTRSVTMLAEDITVICGEDPQTNPQGKIHSDIVELNGWIYFSTHFGNDLPGAYATYTGAHVIGYQLATGLFRDFGVISPNYDSYSGIGVDPIRNYLYVFVTGESPGQISSLYRIDIATGAKTNLGQVGGQYYACLWFFVDQRGDVWFSLEYQNGDLHRLHGDTGVIDDYPNALPPSYLWNVEQIDPSASTQANRWIQWMQPLDGNRALFTLAEGGMLYMFDSSQPIGSGLEFTNIKHIGYNYIGMALGNNRVYYYQRANRGYGHQGDQTPEGIKDFHLLSVSLSAADNFAIYDHGLIQDQNGRLVWRVPSMMTDGNTEVFMTGDWWIIPGDLGTLRYEYNNGVESYVQLPTGEFFADASVNFNNPISVSATPATPVTLVAGQTQQFTASVQGTTNQLVTWSLNPNVGTISPTGLYTAPSPVQFNQTITVTASTNADTAKTATATVILTGGSGGGPTGTAQFVQFDTTTQGSWRGVYGADGFNVINDTVNYPSYATVALSGQSSWTWISSTTDSRGLQKPSVPGDRITATWYSAPGIGSNFSIDLNLTDGKSHQIAVYCLDWDRGGRAEKIDVLDAQTGIVLDTRNVSSFSSTPQYVVWNLKGHVILKTTLTGGPNAVVNGLFFGAGGSIGGPSGTAQFVKFDTTTQGNWKTVYGTDGFNVINDAVTYPSYATVTPSGQSAWTWASSTSDGRGLQKSSVPGDRVAATWYSTSNFSVDINLTDGSTHQVAVYCMDWDNQARSERIDVIDAQTGTVLDTRSIGFFANTPEYVVWNLSGHVILKTTLLGGPNAVINGLFFGGSSGVGPTNMAQFVKFDTTTQGNWKGIYGADGFNVIDDTAKYPSYANVTPNGQQSWPWALSTADGRGLQKYSTANDRIAATWYSGTSFSIDVNLIDGSAHQVAFYCVDWDGQGRAQRIDILDALSGTVLDSRSVSSISSTPEYVIWNLTGHVIVRVTLTGGVNAVVSGIFFGGG